MSGPRADHMDAILSPLNARLGAMAKPRQAYTQSKVPRDTQEYVVVNLTRRFGGQARVDGPISPSLWRLTARAVGFGDRNASVLLDVCSDVLEGLQITVNGVTSTPFAFEAEDGVREDARDSRLYSGLTSWTYAF